MAWTREAEILFCRTKTFHGDAKNSAWQSDRKMAKSVENLWGSARKSLMIGEKKFEFAIYFAQTNFVAVVVAVVLQFVAVVAVVGVNFTNEQIA